MEALVGVILRQTDHDPLASLCDALPKCLLLLSQPVKERFLDGESGRWEKLLNISGQRQGQGGNRVKGKVWEG